MIHQLACYHVARFTLELRTPLSIVTGFEDGEYDTALIRDANGLPAIPGTTLAGVLRHRFEDNPNNAEKISSLFGYAQGNDGAPSRVSVSWGFMHDSKNKPVYGLLLGDAVKRLEDDTLLEQAINSKTQPQFRDRVAINQLGTAKTGAKFDRAYLPAGHRFSAEISLWSNRIDDPDWQLILDTLASPLFRLGGSTRNGFGAVDVQQIKQRTFNLREIKDFSDYSKLSFDVGKTEGFETIKLNEYSHDKIKTLELSLTAEDFWRFGSGDESLLSVDKISDTKPLLEPRVTWKDDQGSISLQNVLIPAASIKGAISHRFAYHHNKYCEVFAEDVEDVSVYDKSENEAVKTLFGFTNDRDDEGRVGSVIIDDIYLTVKSEKVKQLMHTNIDRFSGSVRHGMLFSEDCIAGHTFNLNLIFTENAINELDINGKKALKNTLQDLCEGRLALGAAANRGHGFFNADKNAIQWCDGGAWLEDKDNG